MSIAQHGSLLEAVRGLAWPARRRTSGALPGIHPSRLRGRSPELSEYRLYRQGDDPALLDWRLLARSDRAYVRLADDRAILTTWFVVDASASMAWPTETLAKWRLANALVVALASIVAAAADPVGLLVAHAHGVTRLPPRSRRGVVRDFAATLDEIRPAGSGSLAPALAAARPGTRVVVVSDFLGVESQTRRAVRGLAAAGSDVHGVHVLAAEELDPPRRTVRAVDPEDPRIARPLDEGARAAYQNRFAAWRESLAHEWREVGATWTAVSTLDDPVRAIRRIVGASASRPASSA